MTGVFAFGIGFVIYHSEWFVAVPGCFRTAHFPQLLLYINSQNGVPFGDRHSIVLQRR